MEYREAQRVNASLLAGIEKRCLIWMAGRLPARVNSDHLTALAGLAMAGIGVCYWLAPDHPWLLLAVVALLAVNWFGDSLDGTVARVRHHERPRYGFYVDHVLDAIGTACLFGGLVLGGFMSAGVGAAFLLAYYLLTIEIALATHALGVFRISYWKLGPTELRILVAAGTLLLLRSDSVSLFGHQVLLFDAGGAAGVAGLLVTFAASVIRNTRTLYRAEPLPSAEPMRSEQSSTGGPASSSQSAGRREAAALPSLTATNAVQLRPWFWWPSTTCSSAPRFAPSPGRRAWTSPSHGRRRKSSSRPGRSSPRSSSSI